jgi:hypothetical protein
MHEKDEYDKEMEALDDTGNDDGHAERKEVFAGLSEDELREAIEKARRVDDIEKRLDSRIEKAFGKFGEVNQELAKLREATAKPKEPETLIPTDLLSKIEEHDFTLAEILKQAHRPPEPKNNWVPKEEYDSLVGGLDERLQTNVQLGIMDFQRPAWRQEQGTEEWEDFLKSLPNPDREKVRSTPSAAEYLQYFGRFDKWRKEKNGSQRRIAANTMPRTAGMSKGEELDEETQWYNEM